MKSGIKHLIQCHCVLPQYRNRKEVIFHKFPVFSTFDDELNEFDEKFYNCNNCGITHKIYDLCKSEIIYQKENIRTIKIEDFANTLNKSVYETLLQNKCDVCDFEYAQYILDYEIFNENSFIILSKEDLTENITGTVLKFLAPDKFRVEQFNQKKFVE